MRKSGRRSATRSRPAPRPLFAARPGLASSPKTGINSGMARASSISPRAQVAAARTSGLMLTSAPPNASIAAGSSDYPNPSAPIARWSGSAEASAPRSASIPRESRMRPSLRAAIRRTQGSGSASAVASGATAVADAPALARRPRPPPPTESSPAGARSAAHRRPPARRRWRTSRGARRPRARRARIRSGSDPRTVARRATASESAGIAGAAGAWAAGPASPDRQTTRIAAARTNRLRIPAARTWVSRLTCPPTPGRPSCGPPDLRLSGARRGRRTPAASSISSSAQIAASRISASGSWRRGTERWDRRGILHLAERPHGRLARFLIAVGEGPG